MRIAATADGGTVEARIRRSAARHVAVAASSSPSKSR
jgi:hypothetical protein